MKVTLNESKIKEMIKKAICEVWAGDIDNVGQLYDDYLEGHKINSRHVMLNGQDIIDAIAREYSDNDDYSPEAIELFEKQGIDPDDVNGVFEFLRKLLGWHITRSYDIEVEDNGSVLDYDGLNHDIMELCEEYSYLFDDEEFIMRDIVDEMLR